ncbi:hypothetical protein PspLS_03545 [Pyricularia sp. CBS 133598]|nr:hypothetical protein PspLS_03545 [Pyricularia sp. CBS 133598]
MAPLTGPVTTGLQVFAIPGVVLLIAFLGYASQWVFHTPELQPGPLTQNQTITFNLLLLNLWWNYYKACTVSPGTYTHTRPPSGDDDDDKTKTKKQEDAQQKPTTPAAGQRWCRKCDAPKPPRAHHCRHCRRCIPKMDHHCPWTGNCVSMQTFPYFYRFLVSTNLALWYLARLLYLRFRAIFDERNLPAYLGPSPTRIALLTVVSIACALVSLALSVLLTTTTKAWLFNRTMIEDWEVERHESLVGRQARGGSTWWASEEEGGDESSSEETTTAANGHKMMRRVEFPYDIGIWNNMCQAMGTRNILAWFWPFAGGPTVSRTAGSGVGWDWEENGFNTRVGMWPPPDPDKQRRGHWRGNADTAVKLPTYATPEEEKAAFKARQERDQRLRRRRQLLEAQQGSGIVAELEEDEELEDLFPEQGRRTKYSNGGQSSEKGLDGEPGWTNADGERLRDFGVDEDSDDVVEDDVSHSENLDHDDDEDVPLGELLRRRRVASRNPDT